MLMDSSSSPTSARHRRKRLMAEKSAAKKRPITDENWNPQGDPVISDGNREIISNRIALSPLPFRGKEPVVNVPANVPKHYANTARPTTKKKKICTASDVSPPFLGVNSSNGCPPKSLLTGSGHSSSSPKSEVLNPSSSRHSKKSNRQSHEVLQAVGSIRLNFDQQLDSEFHSPDGFSSVNKNPQLYSEIYEKAENEACLYLGDPSCICSHCGARMWYEERSDKTKKTGNPDFSICCFKGKVQLPFLQKPPDLLLNLMTGQDHRGVQFKENIRAFNSMFSFTSIGGKIQSSINDGGGPPQFILSGQNFHRIGSLLPEPGCMPKFAQLYIYDTDNEVVNRVNHFTSRKSNDNFDSSLVDDLTKMIDEHNPLAQSFRRARDFVMQDSASNFCLRLYRNRSKDARVYNLPTSDEVAALIVGDMSNMEVGRDIVVKKLSGELCRLHETHTAFLPLQYPLLFPYGEDGFQENIPIRGSEIDTQMRKRVRISLREFIAFRIQERDIEFGNIVNARRLFQQFVVDSYTMIESQRLSFIRLNQKVIRCDILNGIQEAVTRGETESSSVGKRVILPASFTGGMRYMFNNCQDAMAICKRFGYPDLFITITCNTNWREIHEFVSERGLTPGDRPDIVCRVFKMKLDQMMTDFKKEEIFGKVVAGMYTVEFQKRGLPHAHILLWLSGENKLRTGNDIDKLISAELPDPVLYPRLAHAVSSYMIHGPCGVANSKSPCMKDGRCSKYFPKKFHGSTTIDEEGYPQYRRRDLGLSVNKKGIKLDNRSVVPYNPYLLMRYDGHVNVEYCNKSNSIKYLFKYVNKGPDRATIQISNDSENSGNTSTVDEIKQYYDCRYLSPCEAVWRIFAFDIHQRWPPVQKLSFHLPNEQTIIFNDNDSIDAVLRRNEEADTMFLAWFEANRDFVDGRDLTYSEFPVKFVYDRQERKWHPRKQGQCIGRLNYIPPGTGELYYMRIMLTVQKGCTDFASLRTVNGKTYPTFQEACYALGLLADDREFIDAIVEASQLASGYQLRRLFVTLLVTNTMTKPDVVWNSTWNLLSDGIIYDRRKTLNAPGLQVGDEELKNLCLIEIEKLLQTNGKSLRDYACLPIPDLSDMFSFENRLIVDEISYDRIELEKEHSALLQSLTSEQRGVYDEIMEAVIAESGRFFFLYGYGGTGKTFLWKTLSAGLRSQGKIVLNVASSGIASLLLPGGRTAHSTFSIPLEITEESTCNIKQGSLRAKLLLHTKLIIWDEAPMLNKLCFEAFDRTLRDIMRIQDEGNIERPFGGKCVVLGGDFRQILPVIRKGSRQDIIGAAINSSPIWKSCRILKLSRNMRLENPTFASNNEDIRQFAEWILQIGGGNENANENGECDIQIPDDLLIHDCEHPLLSLVEFVYPQILENMKISNFFQERGILAPTLESVEQVNDFLISLIPGDETEYFSSDSVCHSDEDYDVQGEWFTTEFLNEIKCSGVPNHRLKLKVGVPVMLMRNIDQATGLCNGTRLLVNDLGKNFIGATVITGKNIGDKILIPRMNLVPSDPGLPFKFQRRQFPIVLCFAMTINKSQGQSLSHVGLYLPRPVFTHGQLYVAVSRVKSRKGLKMLILDDEGRVSSSTKNVVYKEVFDNM